MATRAECWDQCREHARMVIFSFAAFVAGAICLGYGQDPKCPDPPTYQLLGYLLLAVSFMSAFFAFYEFIIDTLFPCFGACCPDFIDLLCAGTLELCSYLYKSIGSALNCLGVCCVVSLELLCAGTLNLCSYLYKSIGSALNCLGVCCVVFLELLCDCCPRAQAGDPRYPSLVKGIYAFRKPKNPDLDIVFIHGLQVGDHRHAWRKTWTVPGTTDVWPDLLLGQDFPRARVLSISYDSLARMPYRGGGRMTLKEIAQMLVPKLTTGLMDVGCRPLVLVGHSLGGLVIKQLCVEMDAQSRKFGGELEGQAAQKFLDSVRGLVFFATPHQGSDLAHLADLLLPRSCLRRGAVASCLHTLSRESTAVNKGFAGVKQQMLWLTLGFHETEPTFIKVRCCPPPGIPLGRVVSPSSAAHEIDDDVPVDNANHIDICKNMSTGEQPYTKLTDYIRNRTRCQAAETQV